MLSAGGHDGNLALLPIKARPITTQAQHHMTGCIGWTTHPT